MPEVSVFCPACGRATSRDEPAANDIRDKVLGALAYVALIPALIFLLIPTFHDSRSIRFHSWQSVLFSLSTLLLALALRLTFFIFSFLPLLAWLLLGIAALGVLMSWVVLVVKAAQGQSFELPPIGPWAMRLASPSVH